MHTLQAPWAEARGFFCSKISALLDFAHHKQTRRKLRFLVAGFAFIPGLKPGVFCMVFIKIRPGNRNHGADK